MKTGVTVMRVDCTDNIPWKAMCVKPNSRAILILLDTEPSECCKRGDFAVVESHTACHDVKHLEAVNESR